MPLGSTGLPGQTHSMVQTRLGNYKVHVSRKGDAGVGAVSWHD